MTNSVDPDQTAPIGAASSRSTLFASILKLVSNKVGRSKPPPVLTVGFNRLKPPRSICQKVVNTGQFESEWSIENFMWPI